MIEDRVFRLAFVSNEIFGFPSTLSFIISRERVVQGGSGDAEERKRKTSTTVETRKGKGRRRSPLGLSLVRSARTASRNAHRSPLETNAQPATRYIQNPC